MISQSPPSRRSFLSGVTLLLASCQPARRPDDRAADGPADVTLGIGPVLVDIAKDHTISTIGYNGSVPAPPIRLREGVPVTVDVFNDTDTPEFVHWHGQIIPADVDGAEEEKGLVVPAHGHLRYRMTPQYIQSKGLWWPSNPKPSWTRLRSPLIVDLPAKEHA